MGNGNPSTERRPEAKRPADVHGIARPSLLVLTMVFPHAGHPTSGLFIRERMFRVANQLPVVVVAPQPWFPFHGLIRLFKPHFRPGGAAAYEVRDGVEIFRPRFFSVPGIFKRLDGIFMALGSLATVRRVAKKHAVDLIDAHFGYPDGNAAVRLGKWLGLPVMVTLRGKEQFQIHSSVAGGLRRALLEADRVICVSSALRDVALSAGAAPARVGLVGNGVDLQKFSRMDRAAARAELGLPPGAKVLLSVGRLVELKGFHRVIEVLPTLLRTHPDLHYVAVGGPVPEGDMTASLHAQVKALGLADRVHFVGAFAPERLRVAYSAADLFVLATRSEGWCNVFLEAMACGLPVVTTRVGGNPEVVCSEALGTLVEFGDPDALARAIADALERRWDTEAIIDYARSNDWSHRVDQLRSEYVKALAAAPTSDGRMGTT